MRNLNFVFVGDIHGSKSWKKPVARYLQEGVSQIIFLGDYLDSFEYNSDTQSKNLYDIISFKEKYPDRVTLLIGNHDYHYIIGDSAISGYSNKDAVYYRSILVDAIEFFQIAWRYNNYLATHAGINEPYYNHHLLPYIEEKGLHNTPIDEVLNTIFYKKDIINTVGYARGGNKPTGGVLWSAKSELLLQPFNKDYNQIVGHTQSSGIEIYSMYNNKYNNTYYFVDTGSSNQVGILRLSINEQ